MAAAAWSSATARLPGLAAPLQGLPLLLGWGWEPSQGKPPWAGLPPLPPLPPMQHLRRWALAAVHPLLRVLQRVQRRPLLGPLPPLLLLFLPRLHLPAVRPRPTSALPAPALLQAQMLPLLLVPALLLLRLRLLPLQAKHPLAGRQLLPRPARALQPPGRQAKARGRHGWPLQTGRRHGGLAWWAAAPSGLLRPLAPA